MLKAKSRISTKISLLVGTLAGLVSISVGILIHRGSTEIIFEQALERLKYETSIKSLGLVKDIESLTLDTLYLAGTPPISGIPRATTNSENIDPVDGLHLITWENRLKTIFSELIRAKPNYLQIRFIGINNNGEEIVRVDRIGSNIIAISPGELQKKGHTDYFKKSVTMHPGDIYLSDVTLNREHGQVMLPPQPVIRAATPIYFEGKVFGIIIINMDFSLILQAIINMTPQTQTPYVINKQGYILAGPEPEKTFGFDLGHETKITDNHPAINLAQFNNRHNTESTFFEDHADGLNVMHIVKVRFDPYIDPHDSGHYLGIALSTSTGNLLAEANQLRNQVFLVIVVLLIISFLLSHLLATRLMRPLRKITQASDDLAEGRFVGQLPVHDKDEIGDLARSFDNMKHQLDEKEQALLVTQAEAHEASKMASLGEMASGVAHEINSPILEISMVAERVKRRIQKGNTADIEEAMDQMIHSVDHISEIIESLRNLSRHSEDDLFEFISVNKIIDDVIVLSRERFMLKGVLLDVIYNETSEDIQIECQRLQISQILINLINNAYDEASTLDEKWVKILITENENDVVIRVTDSGKGISESIENKIFEPMFTSKDIGKGTGLGLSISASIAEKHFGSLKYDNQSEHTSFILRLPKRQT